MNFSNTLTQWYLQNKRDLPWRNTTNPYYIWLSEIMLQQTRVLQALPFYLNFLNEFPTIFDLAHANEEKVLKLWQGLGYYSRARNLHKTAQYIAFEKNGIFPDNFNDILKLTGVGQYTAAAIASFAFSEVVPVVDGNVFRVLARYFDIESDISIASTKNEFIELAKILIDQKNPALFNQAIMEFGATQCVPKNPDCSVCIFNLSCAALKFKKVNVLPIKSKKSKVRNRFFDYLVFIDNQNKTLIKKRIEKDIWQNLYEFPMIETEFELNFNDIKNQIENKFSSNSIKNISVFNSIQIKHKLSHQLLHLNFYRIDINNSLESGIFIDEINNFPFPIVIHNFIKKYLV